MSTGSDTKTFVDGIVTAMADEAKARSVAPRVQKAIESLSKQAKEDAAALVETAVLPNPEEKKKLIALVTKFAESPMDVTFRTNADLLGGIRMTIGDLIIDTSLSAKLSQLATHLTS